MRRKPGWMRSVLTPRCRSASPATGCRPGCRCRAISIRPRWLPAAMRCAGRWRGCARRWGAALTCSISGTGCCRRRRPSMSNCWPACWHDPAGGGADESRRSGLAGGGAAVSLQSVQRPGDHPAAASAAGPAGAADRLAAGEDRGGNLCPARRRLAAARQYRGAGRRARSRPWRRQPLLYRDALLAVAAWPADEVVCLPLYPQFSTTTTQSSLDEWQHEARRRGFDRPTRAVSSWPTAPGFIAALAGRIEAALAAAPPGKLRLLLSAHGLPQAIVRAGDPYPEQVAATATAVAAALGRQGLDWRVCYQSRVGPLAWLGPSLDEEVRRAAADGAGLLVAPISFVSEHSETLVELDRDYRRLAEALGVRFYLRVPTVGTDPAFIAALAELVEAAG